MENCTPYGLGQSDGHPLSSWDQDVADACHHYGGRTSTSRGLVGWALNRARRWAPGHTAAAPAVARGTRSAAGQPGLTPAATTGHHNVHLVEWLPTAATTAPQPTRSRTGLEARHARAWHRAPGRRQRPCMTAASSTKKGAAHIITKLKKKKLLLKLTMYGALLC